MTSSEVPLPTDTVSCKVITDETTGDPIVQQKVFDQWNLNGTGPLATNGIEAGVKVRPDEKELAQMDNWPCPEFRSGWDSYFKNKPDKPVMHYSVIAGYAYGVPQLHHPFG